MFKIISIGIGGFAGAIGRYLITDSIHNLFKVSFPLGTLIANLLGCFLLGFIYTITLEKQILNPTLKTGLTTGMLGALTTFSTFTYETLVLFENKEPILALSNILISVTLGLIMGLAGINIAKFI
mgnify:CR=1 FL=1